MTIYTGSIEMGFTGFGINYIVVYYNWTSGDDLDQRTRMVSPEVSPYLGWARPFTFLDVLETGNSNGLRYESLLVYVDNFATTYPSSDSIKLELRALWYAIADPNPIRIGATAYQGGDMYLDSTSGLWMNSNYQQRWDLPTYSKVISLSTVDPDNDGELVRYMTIDLGSLAITYSTS